LDQIKASTLRHRLNWVKAHQDDKQPYQDLDIWGHMNCDADKLATSFHECMDRKEVMSIQEGFFTPSSKVCLYDKGKCVSSTFQQSIHQHIQGSKHCQHLQWKHAWDNAMWNSIDGLQ
jgi:hypothetical protein